MTKAKNVSIVGADKEIGIEEAAKILGFDCERVKRHVACGELYSREVNPGQLRFLLSNVLAYRTFVKQRRRALDFMVRQSQELKLDYQ